MIRSASVLFAGLLLALSSLPALANDCVPKNIFFTDKIDQRDPGKNLGTHAVNIDKLYLYVSMDCSQISKDEKFNVRWFFADQPLQIQTIPLGISPSWRTFSFATARSGRWRVELAWTDGSVFATQEIEID